MAPRQDPLGGAGYDDETTTTTTAAVPPGAFDPSAVDTGEAPRLESAWGRSFLDRAAIRARYYQDDSGAISSLRDRLFQWRMDQAQSGQADLASVLDEYVSWEQTSPGYGGRNVGEGNAGRRAATGDRTRSKKTVAWWLEHVRTADDDKLAEYQQQLLDAGYMRAEVYKNPGALQRGTYDAFTQEAFTRLLQDAVMAGDPLTDVLRRRKDDIDQAGGVTKWLQLTGQDDAPPPFQAQVTNPTDIANAQRDISQDLTGRMIDGAPVAEYQGAEVAAQRATYDADVSGAGGTTTAQPSLGAFVEENIRTEHAAEVGAYSYLGNFNALMQRAGLAG